MKRILNLILSFLVIITIFLAFLKSSDEKYAPADNSNYIQYAARLPVPGTVPPK